MSRLCLVRHGQVVGYDKYFVVGHTDVEITEVGVIQMEHMAERLRLTNIKAIYSSDLKRAIRGARIISRAHNVPLYALPELREMNFGDWEGLTSKEIRERFPGELEKREADPVNYLLPGNGEGIGLFAKRIMACFQGILGNQNGNDILLVAHGLVNRVILCNAIGLDLARIFSLQQDYGCLNIIDYFPDRTLVRLING